MMKIWWLILPVLLAAILYFHESMFDIHSPSGKITEEKKALMSSVSTLNAKQENSLSQQQDHTHESISLSFAQPRVPAPKPEVIKTEKNIPTPEQQQTLMQLTNRITDSGMRLDALMNSPEAQSLTDDQRNQLMSEIVKRLNDGEVDPKQFLPGYHP